MSALKVFGSPRSTCTNRVLACIHELGLDYELISVDMKAKEHKQPAFLALNPFGQVPVLEDGDIKLFESRAITKYIASTYKGNNNVDLLGKSPQLMAAVSVWLEVEAHQFNPAIGPLFSEAVLKPVFGGTPDEKVVATSVEKLNKVLDIYEEILSKKKYLAGDDFSLADLHHLSYIQYIMSTPHASLFTSRKHVNAWWENVSSRPSWKKCAVNMKM